MIKVGDFAKTSGGRLVYIFHIYEDGKCACHYPFGIINGHDIWWDEELRALVHVMFPDNPMDNLLIHEDKLELANPYDFLNREGGR